MNFRVISVDLFPACKKYYKLLLGRNTFKYTHLFNNAQFSGTVYNLGADVSAWVAYAKEICAKIQAECLE
eukprot:8947490-Ditylum_brightwellii.AAC.1